MRYAYPQINLLTSPASSNRILDEISTLLIFTFVVDALSIGSSYLTRPAIET